MALFVAKVRGPLWPASLVFNRPLKAEAALRRSIEPITVVNNTLELTSEVLKISVILKGNYDLSTCDAHHRCSHPGKTRGAGVRKPRSTGSTSSPRVGQCDLLHFKCIVQREWPPKTHRWPIGRGPRSDGPIKITVPHYYE